MNRIDSTRAIEKIWNVECKNGQLLYWNYNEECWSIKDDLKLLTKYKRAFEILKEKFDIGLFKDDFLTDGKYDLYSDWHIDLTQEEYELLEELMKGEKN